MAARLTVVVSQGLGGDSHQSERESALVAELMLAAGMDATLVGPLERIEPGSTDLLCLDSFQHSFVIATWLATPQVEQQWRRLGLAGSIREVGVVDATSEVGRRVYHLPLAWDPTTCLSQLRRLQQDRSVKTVGISLPSAGPPRRETPAETTTPRPGSVRPDDSTTGSGSTAERHVSDEEWGELDQLVDDLDALDL